MAFLAATLSSSSSSLCLCPRNLHFFPIPLFTFFFVLSYSFLLFSHLLTAAPPSSSLNPDVALLLQIKPVLSGDGNPLSSWSRSSPLCSWSNVEWAFLDNGTLLDCSSDASSNSSSGISTTSEAAIGAVALNLSGTGLKGGIPAAIAQLSGLRTLDLSLNNLTGGIPLSIGSSSWSPEFMSLSHNQLSGAIPSSLWELCNNRSTTTVALLQELRLDHNQFSGAIPPNQVSCSSLRKLDLSSNLLSGAIPSSLSSFVSLTDLNLSTNSLTGGIPASLLKLLNLKLFDVSDNNLSGKIPSSFGAMAEASAYAGNPMLCGEPLEVGCGWRMDKRLIAVLVIGGMSAAVVTMAVCVAAAHRKRLWWWCCCSCRGDVEAADGGGKMAEEMAIEGKLVRFEGGEHLNVEEVLNAPGEVLGKSSYGTVYKAKLGSGGGGAAIALRLLREDTVSNSDQFSATIRHLANIRCPNIVSLLAYYAGPKGEKLLVYDYLSRGSLADLLHHHRHHHHDNAGSRAGKTAAAAPLSWARRHKIVLGAARGLAHLHYGVRSYYNDTHHIVHGNLKSKNIIVDESFEGHLADYGLAMLMNSAAQSEMLKAAASQGYKAPELVKMSKANPKTDVYNMGIVLLEILTGKRPREAVESPSASEPKQLLLDLPVYVKQAILEERVTDIFDPSIVPNHIINDGLVQALQLAMGCCAPAPSDRPDMKEVVRRLEDIRPVAPTHYTPPTSSSARSPRDVSSL